MTDEAKPLSLVMKLCEVMAAIERVPKTGYNEFHKYKYATEADIVELIRGELSKRHVFIFPSVLKSVRSPHDVETMKWDDIARAKVPTIRKTQLTEVEVQWTFVDGESGEERSIIVHGVGEDNVDKGFYKAFTGCEKYMLMKSFLIPTGDDPEADSKEERKVAKESGKEAAQSVAKRKIEEHEAKNFTPAIFYTWYDESQTARIEGDRSLMSANKDILEPLWNGTVRAVVATADQLEDLKFNFQHRNVNFKLLKSVEPLETQLKKSIEAVKAKKG